MLGRKNEWKLQKEIGTWSGVKQCKIRTDEGYVVYTCENNTGKKIEIVLTWKNKKNFAICKVF